MSDRHTADSITSDALDALYERAEASDQLANRLAHALAAEFDTTVDTVLAEARDAIADTTPDDDTAPGRPTHEQLQQRLDDAEETLRHHTETTTTPPSADTLRADQAEAAIARAHHVANLIDAGAPWTASHHDTANRLREALDGEQDIEPALAATDTATTTRVFAALHRSAEEDVTRVIALHERWVKAGPPPLGTIVARWWDARLVELHDAIRPPASQTQEQP